ncbi:MAG TPA: hypothetical protein VK611_28200 [Acidimicrobiales bacterium]|nr:hypothetical protein [Acidimicrobiales bacterium]
MQRRRGAALLLPAILLLSAACSDDDGGGAGDGDGGGGRAGEVDSAVVDVVARGLSALPRADFRDDEEPRCVAEAIVTVVEIERLEELGLDVDGRTPPTLHGPDLTAEEGDLLYAAYDGCLDFESRDVENFTADGLTEAQARCVSGAYRGSGIPQAQLLERVPDGTMLQASANAHLDSFMSALRTSCRDWITE